MSDIVSKWDIILFLGGQPPQICKHNKGFDNTFMWIETTDLLLGGQRERQLRHMVVSFI